MKIRLTLLAFLLPFFLAAQDRNENSLSPYFIIQSDSADPFPDFPLQMNAADVQISGVIADVEITQVYTNSSKRPLEAVYVFPASTHAAVYAMEMQVGKRSINAEIREKQAARQEYTAAKAEGKTASLLEQDRPNIFRMNVANIMPGDCVVVRISYTEMLVPQDGIYEFVYPTVVAPRYTGSESAALETPAVNKTGSGIPYTRKGIDPLYQFRMHVGLASPVPFEKIESASHKILLSFQEKNKANILLDPSEKDGGNRDFVLRYKLTGPAIKTGMMTFESGDEKYFLFMMQPPQRVAPDSIPPREYIFVMDVSGSMSGYPIETSKKLLSNLVGNLRPDDMFNVVQFAGGAATFRPASVPATAENIGLALAFIAAPQGGGGTELKQGMERAMGIPRTEGYSRTIVIATDGLISAEASVFRSMHERLGEANVFAFGIGSSVNRYLIEGIAYAGNGEPTVVQYSTQADSAAVKFREYITSPVLTKIKVDFGKMDVYDIDPQQVPDLFASRPIIVTGKYRGKAEGDVTVTGLTGKKEFRQVLALEKVKPEKKNKAIRYIWARQRLTLLGYQDHYAGGDTTIRKEITEIGLKYSLLTQYTSFIAIYRKERNKEGIPDSTVIQPLPLPQNMNELSVVIGGTPAQFGNVSPGLVNINSYAINSVACVSMDIARAEVVIVRSPKLFYPFATGLCAAGGPPESLMRSLNGNYLLPSVSWNGGPLLPAEFASPLFSGYSDRMISSLESSASDAFLNSSLMSRGTSNIITRNYYQGTQAELNMNSAGYQQFRYAWKQRKNTRENVEWNYGLQAGEGFGLFSRDVNEDGFADLPLQRTGDILVDFGRTQTRDSSGNAWNTTLAAHRSRIIRRQDVQSENPWRMQDDLSGLYLFSSYNYNRSFRVWNFNYQAKLSSGYSDRTADIAGNSFLADHAFVLASGQIEASKGNIDLSLAAASSWYDGVTIMTDGQQYATGYRANAVNAKISLDEGRFLFVGKVRADYDSRFGSWLSPFAGITCRRGNHSVAASAGRLHSQTFTPGTLFNALLSSRSYSFDRNLLPDDGWQYNLNYTFNRLIAGIRTILYTGISCYDYRRMVIADADSDPSSVNVYNVSHRTQQWKSVTDLTLWLKKGFDLRGYYYFLFKQASYGGNLLDEPLMPRHQAGLMLSWEKSLRIRGSLEFSCAARFTGRQRLPGHGWSDPFVTADLTVTYKFREHWVLRAYCSNLTGFRQRTLIYGANDPYAPGFDASLNWGPAMGRVFGLGISWILPSR